MARKSRYVAYANGLSNIKKEASVDDRTVIASGDNRAAGTGRAGSVQKR